MSKCYYCTKEGIKEKKIVVDVDTMHDIDEDGQEVWQNVPLFSNEWLCQEHLEMEDIDETQS